MEFQGFEPTIFQFLEQLADNNNRPGFYVHIAPEECFLALGVWRPDRSSLTEIRQAIVDYPDRWRRAREDRKFRERFSPDGDSLKRPPRGFPADHPWIEDLKRTDFIGLEALQEQDVLDKRFPDYVASSFTAGRPFMRFLCDALRVPF